MKPLHCPTPHALECYRHGRKVFPRGTLVANPGLPCAPDYLADADGPALCV